MNKKNSNNETQWQPCAAGAIGSMADSARARKATESRREFLKKATATSAVVATAGFVGWQLVDSGVQANYPGGIACVEVVDLLPEYLDKSLNDNKLVTSMSTHLAACKHCSDKRDMLVATEQPSKIA